MSRAKVGYAFNPVPDDIAPEWSRLPYQTRMLGVSLWLLGRGEPIPVPSDGWVVYLCGKLEINGPDRPNVSRALLRLHALGLLSVCDGSATCLLRVCQVSALCLPFVCTVSAERKSSESLKASSSEESRREKSEREIATRAVDRSARFEKPPVPEFPPELVPTRPEPSSWLVVWKLFAAQRGLDPIQLGHPGRFRDALTAVAGAAEVEAGVAEGVAFENATRRLLGAWSGDKWVRDKQPTIDNLAKNLHRYASVLKMPVKTDDPRTKDWTDAALLAMDPRDEGDLEYFDKMRRWELVAKKEQREAAAAKAGAK